MIVQGVEKKTPVIGICISTFNRCEKVYALVNNILNYQGDEIEVIVCDNASTDGTDLRLSEINDHRFCFIKNNKNIGPLLSALKALSLTTAKYAFICLDKDWIDYNNIGHLINRLNDSPDIAFGRCSLNLKSTASDILYEKGFASVLNMAYLSQHPTGIFYKVDIFKNLPMLKNISEEQKNFGFYPDLINAEMAMYGKSLQINLPVFFTETKDESKKILSFTYTKETVFFSPVKRWMEFNIYLNNVQQLNLPNDELYKLIRKLYDRGLLLSTFVYRDIMNDSYACAHYGMNTRKVGIVELWKLSFKFASLFLQQQLSISYSMKLYIVFYRHVRFLFMLFYQYKSG